MKSNDEIKIEVRIVGFDNIEYSLAGKISKEFMIERSTVHKSVRDWVDYSVIKIKDALLKNLDDSDFFKL